MSVTIKDVAKHAGVSFATVSRVLRGEQYVKAETQQAVRHSIEELGYSPNSLARSFKTKKTNIIGFIVPDISNPFFAMIARGIESQARRHNYDLIVYDTHFDPRQEMNGLKMLVEKRVDGIILSPISDQILEMQIPGKIPPIVLVDNTIEGANVDSVTVDNVEAARKLVDHLITLGHRKIATITGPLDQMTGRDRLLGYFKSLEIHEIPRNNEWVKEGDFQSKSGHDLMIELLNLAERPTAVFAANNFIALGAMMAIREYGLHVPHDVAIVSFDDVPEFSSLIDPPLTVVTQSTSRLGRIACDLLLKRLSTGKPTKPRKVVIEAKMLIRGSCGVKP